MGLTRDGHGQVVGIAALEPPSRRERLSRDNLMNQLIPVMATIAAPNHSLWGREEVSGVLLKTDSFVVHDKAHLVIDRPGPWTCLTIAIKSLYVASGTRQITFERKVRHGQNGRIGTDGEDGKDATGNDGYGRGKPGGKGHDGGRGQAGTTPWLPDLLLVIGEVTFQNPDDARHLKIRVIAQGGNGGMGGNGGPEAAEMESRPTRHPRRILRRLSSTAGPRWSRWREWHRWSSRSWSRWHRRRQRVCRGSRGGHRAVSLCPVRPRRWKAWDWGPAWCKWRPGRHRYPRLSRGRLPEGPASPSGTEARLSQPSP